MGKLTTTRLQLKILQLFLNTRTLYTNFVSLQFSSVTRYKPSAFIDGVITRYKVLRLASILGVGPSTRFCKVRDTIAMKKKKLRDEKANRNEFLNERINSAQRHSQRRYTFLHRVQRITKTKLVC